MNFDTEESLDRFIAAFEDGTWPIADWKHGHHLVMATCYVFAHGRDEALARARVNIPKYNEAQGGKNTRRQRISRDADRVLDRLCDSDDSFGERQGGVAVRHVVECLAPQARSLA